MTRLLKTLVALAFLCSPLALGIPTASAKNGDALELAWSVKTNAVLTLAPVVVGDLVIVVPTDQPMTAFHAKTGEVAWTYTSGEGVWTRGFSSDGERVYACLKGGRIAALNPKDGREIWNSKLGINCLRPQHVDGDTVFVATTHVGAGLPNIPVHDAKLYALNKFDGSTEWVFTSENYLLQTPATYGDTVFVGGSYVDESYMGTESGSSRFYALDRKTQKIKWTFTSLDGVPKKMHATANELLYAGYEDWLFSVDKETGKKKWEHDTSNWIPSFVVEGDVVYYGSATTYVNALNIKDGKYKWRFNIPGQKFNYLLIKPVLVDNNFYFLSQRGQVYALDKRDGTQLWSYPTEMNARVGLSVSDGYIYIGASNGDLHAYKIMK